MRMEGNRKKLLLDKAGYSLQVIEISPDLWLYETGKGIEIYFKEPGRVVKDILLPWRKLDETIERRRKILRKRRSRP